MVRHALKHPLWPAIIALAAGLAVAATAIPRVAADFRELSVQDELETRTADGVLTAAQAAQAESALRSARGWSADPRFAIDAALLHWRSAPAQAEGDLNAALAAAPLRPDLWLSLAHFRLARGDAAAAWQAGRMSMLTGAVVPDITMARLDLALRLQDQMSEQDRTDFKRQLRLDFILYPREVRQRMATEPANAALLRQVVDEFTFADFAQMTRIHVHLPN